MVIVLRGVRQNRDAGGRTHFAQTRECCVELQQDGMWQREEDWIGRAEGDWLAGFELRGLAGGAPDVQFHAVRAVREFDARGVLQQLVTSTRKGGQCTSLAVVGSYDPVVIVGTMASFPVSKYVCVSGDNQSTLRILSVVGGRPSVSVLRRWVSAGPLNNATKAQKSSALLPRTENGMIWQLRPRSLPVTTQVLLSRVAQAVLTTSLREELDVVVPDAPVLDLAPSRGPGLATKARIPESIRVTNRRISEGVVMGEAMVFKREWTSVGATKNCAVFMAASRSVHWALVRVESATRSASLAIDSKYAGGGLGGGKISGASRESSSSTTRGRKRDAGVTGSRTEGWNTAGADCGCAIEVDLLF